MLIENKIKQFMYSSVGLIAGFVKTVMSYEIEDTGHSIILYMKMGDTLVNEKEIPDEVACKYLERLLSRNKK